MSINLNMKSNFINMFRLFHVNFANSVSNLIDISVNYNMKVNSIEFFPSFCVSDFSFNNNVNLFCNIDSNVIFNDEIFYNRIVSKNYSQNFYYSNDEKFQNHKLQESTFDKLILNSILFSSLISLNYYDQTVFLLNKSCSLNNVLII